MDDAVRILNDLIATCRDSEEGFGKAAKGTHSERLRNRLTGIAKPPARKASTWVLGFSGGRVVSGDYYPPE